MPRKTCTKQFKCEVVALYESTPRATVNAIAFDIGVNRTLLGTWLDVFGTDTKTIVDGERERPPAEGLSDAAGMRGRQAPGRARDRATKAVKYFA